MRENRYNIIIYLLFSINSKLNKEFTHILYSFICVIHYKPVYSTHPLAAYIIVW